MKFSIKQVTAITGVVKDRIKEWIWRRYVLPSVETAAGRGTQNFFSYEDLYLIELFRHMTESGKGWSRKVAGEFMNAISQDELAVFTRNIERQGSNLEDAASRMWEAKSRLKEAEKAKEVTAELLRDIEAFQKAYQKELHRLNDRFFIAFIRKSEGSEVLCIPFFIGAKNEGEFPDTLEDVKEYLLDADDVYLVNLSNLVEKVDSKVVELYPEIEF